MDSKSISVKALKTELSELKDSTLLIGFFKDKAELNGELKKLDNENNSIISSYIKNNGFKGEKGEVKSIYADKNVKNVILAGLGEEG